MDMTPEIAALMAQVIPTLLIVVALEPRFRGEGAKAKSALGRWLTSTGREIAAVSSLLSVALSLQVVFLGESNTFATWFVVASTAWLILVLMGLFAIMFVAEQRNPDGVS